MNKYTINILNFFKKINNKIRKPKDPGYLKEFDYTGEESSKIIKEFLEKDSPCMIARFGSAELACVRRYYNIHKKKRFIDYIHYIFNQEDSFWWDEDVMNPMFINAGFFSKKVEYFEKFSQLMLECMPNVDILGSWLKDELIFKNQLKNSIKVKLSDLEPYTHKDPWSKVLKDKNVLIIHPFEKSIRRQYELNRKKIFNNPNVLPDFNLITLKAVQSIAGNKTEYETWFDALEDMKSKIIKIDFDIAILGCGAYGFPLSSFIKEIGKKAVHLGGATQILFGIKGKRWDNHEVISSLYNSYWVRPLPEETLENKDQVEQGAYW